ncbi:MAG: YaiI/YqxD family protein [Clostridia bacterium]|nr:YaiI/YqxD family protein [Clostridia bacterium]
MRILIDADGCPVVDIVCDVARNTDTECIILCDTSHVFSKQGAQTITVSKGADSVDFALVNMLKQGDIVITQDYGLAAMCLARKALPINQDGMIYNDNNIDALLLARHNAKKIRNSGGRLKGPSKRMQAQNDAFRQKLENIISELEK